MPDDPQDPQDIAQRTIANYRGRADAFWAGTRDHDVSQNLTALLGAIEGPAPWTVLDFGCGPGRDLKALADLGHVAIGLDGTPEFAAMARDFSACSVWQQDFLVLDLPVGHFDGIFANASLFHVPTSELPRVLAELRTSLKANGVLFCSNPRGDDEEGWNGDRYGVFHSLAGWTRYVQAAGFALVDYYWRPTGVPAEQQNWLATVWRRVDSTAAVPV
ncbi:MAG: class I SAM-dependent methyltransferase [Myxococcales bacterium]|nr:class I SAM-dependent methyltransferase [Myxococcales bacterium]